MPWPDHVPQDESGDSLRMRYSRRRAPGPGIPTTLLLPRRMLLLGTDASRRATGSRQYVVAHRSRSSAYTRYRDRFYAPSRPTERDSPCRILRNPCHTSRSPRRWRAAPILDLARPATCRSAASLLVESLLAAAQARVARLEGALSTRYDPLDPMALNGNVAALLAFSRADSCDKGSRCGDFLSALANNTWKADRMQDASRCHTRYGNFGRRCTS